MAHRKGEKHPAAKLNADQVRDARRAFTEGKASGGEIAKAFGVCETTMRLVLQRKTWRHVE